MVVPKIIEVEVVGGIGHPQVAVVVQGIALEITGKSLAEHALEHVSLTDQLLGPSHHLLKTFLLKMVFELQGLQILGGKLVGSLGLQVCHDLT